MIKVSVTQRNERIEAEVENTVLQIEFESLDVMKIYCGHPYSIEQIAEVMLKIEAEKEEFCQKVRAVTGKYWVNEKKSIVLNYKGITIGNVKSKTIEEIQNTYAELLKEVRIHIYDQRMYGV